ncbi:MAG: cysteine hydrolase [Erysipelotrichaceae bacterium]|nr:cysteine hydrolase [Erysipelotrichaceae bacterium]
MSKVLIVVDMQKDFVDGSLGTKEAVAIVSAVAEEIGKDYDHIFFTRDTHQSDYLQTNEGRHLPVEHCIEDTDGWQLDKEVAQALLKLPEASCTLLNKPTFGSDRLVDLLKKHDEKERIDSITLIGLCTDICVVTNALLIKTAFPEIEIKVLKDCCAGVTPESHEAALTTMKMCQIEIV